MGVDLALQRLHLGGVLAPVGFLVDGQHIFRLRTIWLKDSIRSRISSWPLGSTWMSRSLLTSWRIPWATVWMGATMAFKNRRENR